MFMIQILGHTPSETSLLMKGFLWVLIKIPFVKPLYEGGWCNEHLSRKILYQLEMDERNYNDID